MGYKYDKLRGRIVEMYGSQAQFSKRLGTSKNTLSKKMSGKSGFSQTDIVKWCDLLAIPADEIGAYFFA